MIACESPHAALLNLNLTDTRGLETFRQSQRAAPDLPVILIVDPQDEILAIRLMREGAQDFLVKKQVDTAPLAHAIRNAVSRHRLLSAARAAAATDWLTGLPNRAAFLAAAERDRKIAAKLDRRWMVLVAEPRELAAIESSYGEQRRDLELVADADFLQSIAGGADLVARMSESSFAMSIFDTDTESAEEAWARIRAAASERRIEIGACIFDPGRPIPLEVMLEIAAADLVPNRQRLAHFAATV